MNANNGSSSNNGRGSGAWARTWTHVSVDRRSAGYCRLTFDHPPINTVTATTVAELAELVDLIEHDEDLNVVVPAGREILSGRLLVPGYGSVNRSATSSCKSSDVDQATSPAA